MMMGNSSEATSSGTTGNGVGSGSGVLKKGPWTAAEDAILIEYVRKHGEGNWNAVQKNSGLSRCGKSCRLRWANHLRPNLKKGSFSAEEERLILELHAKLGNKWARMAAQLPGRTDNEIKNYWNTRMKRRQRAGLPLYPQDIQRESSTFHLHHQHQNQQQQQFPNSSSQPQLSSFLPAAQRQKTSFTSSPLSLFDPLTFSSNSLQTQHNSSLLTTPTPQFNLFRENENSSNRNSNINSPSFALPVSSVSPFSPSMSFFNQTLPNQFHPSPPIQYNSTNVNINLGSQFEPIGIIPRVKSELPSCQTPLSLQRNSDHHYNSNMNPSLPTPLSRSNSGLLDALLQEAQAISRNENSRGKELAAESEKGKCVTMEGDMEDASMHMGSVFGESNATPETQWEESSSAQSSIGMKSKKEPIEDVNSMDDDLTSLLDNLPTPMSVPEWYRANGEPSNDPSSTVTDVNQALEIQQEASASPAETTDATAGRVIKWQRGSSCWNKTY